MLSCCHLVVTGLAIEQWLGERSSLFSAGSVSLRGGLVWSALG